MKINLFLTLMLLLNSLFCHSQVKYDTQNSADIKRMYIYENNKVIDSIPTLRDFIQKYSFKKADTLKVLYSESDMALKFARNALDNKYGKEKMDSEEPFLITLFDNKFWFVRGTLPEGYLGGTVLILFSKYNGDILLITHGK
jgi:hypothetical protein